MATPLRKKIHLLLIDPQNDFAASGNGGKQQGSLFVPHADVDMEKISDFIDRVGHKLHDIHVTLDSHHLLHIANPGMWKNSHGDHPKPFTQITATDVLNGTWTTTIASHHDRALKYLRELENTKRYAHTIWPPHCLIGEWGHGIEPRVATSLRKWCENRFATVDYVTKGSNPWTEHFSAVRAEVPDPKDANSQINTRLIDTLEQADEVLISGIAGSHCVANTVKDIADSFKSADYVKKFTLLEDTISPVPMCEKLQEDFVNSMKARGMNMSTTDKYLV